MASSTTSQTGSAIAKLTPQIPRISLEVDAASDNDDTLATSSYASEEYDIITSTGGVLEIDRELSACRRSTAISPNRQRVHLFQKKASIASKDNGNLLHPRHAEYGFKKRELRSDVDWTENTMNGEHLWVDTSVSGDFCYIGEAECTKSGQRKKCTCCRIVVHTGCLSRLDQIRFRCKPTFREASHRNYRENTVMRHHWVHRRRQDGKCKQCGKSFQQRFSFQCKEIIAISCSWCKSAYHNKVSCFMIQQIEEPCTMGVHADVIIPPSWIIKLPQKGSFKSSIRRRKKPSFKKRDSGGSAGSSGSGTSCEGGIAGLVAGNDVIAAHGPSHHAVINHHPCSNANKIFIVKPIPSPRAKPILVFINPKSGGNQGAKLLHKFHWLLNPRQVFDLSQGGPRMALELYRKVPNLRILACGGDGTVGWILSTIDSLGIEPAPPVAILPLGTGNDLARTLNWGGGYTDEPISKILKCVEEGSVVQVDRWNLESTSLPETELSSEQLSAEDVLTGTGSVASLPLDVMNNYFSIGADAHVTLVFHESREANPEKFNSRFRNKMFYAGAGGKDLLKRSWKDLAEHIKLECDGQDFTPKVKEFKFHCLLFLNIQKYAAGTTPWGNPSSNVANFEPQRHDDGYLEVIGFTTASLAGLQIGAHGGVRLTQCRSASLLTSKPIPVQVDGEPCRLLPCQIVISRRNQANMIQKPKQRNSVVGSPHSFPGSSIAGRLPVHIHCISMADYETLHYDKRRLCEAAISLGVIEVSNDIDLNSLRSNINELIQNTLLVSSNTEHRAQADNWCYVDSTTAERFFRIDRTLEQVHYVADISSGDLYIVEPDLETVGCLIQILRTNRQPTDSAYSPQSRALESDVNVGTNDAKEDPRHVTADVVSCCTTAAEADYAETECTDDSSTAETILHDACKSGDLEKLLEIHRTGVDLSCTDRHGHTALHHAAAFGHKRIVKYLIQQAPAVILNIVDNVRQQTALHKAAYNRHHEVCSILVAAGSSVFQTDLQGNTPRSLALQVNDQQLANFFENEERMPSGIVPVAVRNDAPPLLDSAV